MTCLGLAGHCFVVTALVSQVQYYRRVFIVCLYHPADSYNASVILLTTACFVFVYRTARTMGRTRSSRAVPVAAANTTESDSDQSVASPPVTVPAVDTPVRYRRRKHALALPSDEEDVAQEEPSKRGRPSASLSTMAPQPSTSAAAQSPQPSTSGTVPSYERAASPEQRLNRRDRRFRRRQTPPPQPLFDSSSD